MFHQAVSSIAIIVSVLWEKNKLKERINCLRRGLGSLSKCLFMIRSIKKEKGNQQLLSNTSGFTLIELLLVIFIMTLLIGISMASYNFFNEVKKLELDTRKFIEVLELARKKAISGDQGSCSSLESYLVSYGGTTYSLQIKCLGVSSSSLADYNLSENVSFTSSAVVEFKPLEYGLDASTDITLINNNIGKSRTVTVTRSGSINYE